MSDETTPQGGGVLRYVLLAVAAIYIVGSLYLMLDMRGRITALETKDRTQDVATKEIQQKLHITAKNIEDTAEELSSRVGMTQEEIAKRSAELRRQQQIAESRLTEEQKKQQAALVGVTGEVTSVKSELGGAKTDIASTKTDLEATKAKLEKAIGDLGVQSGLIARNASELEYLKHKGDRNYFEFTLQKNSRTPVGTISLELKRADAKKNKFTLNVLADDTTIEKKDRTAKEPLQFYAGRDRALYELVVFSVSKNSVSGYLSTPK